jgi:hypothetical protein
MRAICTQLVLVYTLHKYSTLVVRCLVNNHQPASQFIIVSFVGSHFGMHHDLNRRMMKQDE